MHAARRVGVATGRRAPTLIDLKFAELGSFLAARRAEVTPQQVGLPNTGPRRLSGLRREEVAMLAGIGASWYTWIEQGRAKNVSPNILTAIAEVLSLNETQRQYMMRLAGYAVPLPPLSPEDHRELSLSAVNGFLPNPAYVLDCYWNISVANSAAVRLLGIDGQWTNYLDLLFNHPQAADRFPCWEQEAANAVAHFRAECAEMLGDPRLGALIARLRDKSAMFAKLWERYLVSDEPPAVQILNHPELGQVSLIRLSLEVTSRSGLKLVLLRPRSTGTADRINRWVSTRDTR
jgi:transcriptional regulator with XRE-family HTH domain